MRTREEDGLNEITGLASELFSRDGQLILSVLDKY